MTNPCAALNIGSADCPRYRATNMEVIELDTGNWILIRKAYFISTNLVYHILDISSLCLSDFGSTFSGVLTDERGRVQAIWGSFSTQVSTLNLFLLIVLGVVAICFEPYIPCCS